MLSSSQIRTQFIEFFQHRYGHTFVPSSPVVPVGDPSLLFANAGMNQFKDVFLGTGTRPYKRAVNTQKCIRAGGKHNDLDDVGRDTYHHTFFEMLGNWSFGDYFKREAICWAWELLTQVWGLEKDRLHVTIFGGDASEALERDEEAAAIWHSECGVPRERIHDGSKKDNFWEMGNTGPCGPCTEIHIDRTPDKSGSKLVNAGTDQVIEIWNLVFIQYNRDAQGKLHLLPAKHVDTGMGFERVTAVLQGKSSNYDTDVFTPLFEAIRSVTGAAPYTGRLDDAKDTAYRVIADHARMMTFALTDHARFGSKGREAVLRSVLRRAFRFGYQVFELRQPFIHRLVPVIVDTLGGVFPELTERPEKVQQQIEAEERDFLRTIARGLEFFEQACERAAATRCLSGQDAFELHTNRGFPIDLTKVMAQERGLQVDEEAFKQLNEEHIRISGAGRKVGTVAITAKGGLPETDDRPRWDSPIGQGDVLGWVLDNTFVQSGTLRPGQSVGLVLDTTCFYAESGGQVGDRGTIRTSSGTFQVNDTQKLGNAILHLGQVSEGEISVGQTAALEVDRSRDHTRKNHTATHLVHWALRTVLGEHVEQRGSKVKPEGFSFDFAHEAPLTREELETVERLVNAKIIADLPVRWRELPTAQAKALPGVRAFFGDKYGEVVRVVEIGDGFSREFCGGTHLDRTGEAGLFKLTAQAPVSKGVRRIEGVTGEYALQVVQSLTRLTDELASKYNCKPEELPQRLASLEAQKHDLEQQLARALFAVGDALLAGATEVGGVKVIVGPVPDAPEELLRVQVDRLKQLAKSAVVVIGWTQPDKALLLASVTKDLVERHQLKAGDLIKELAPLIGGKGGGPPTMASGSGKEPSQLPAALDRARTLLASKLAK